MFFAGAMEFDDRPGPVREEIAPSLRQWRRETARTIAQAVDVGHLRPDSDPEQMAFEIYGVMLALHHDMRLFGAEDARIRAQRSLERIIGAYQATAAAA